MGMTAATGSTAPCFQCVEAGESENDELPIKSERSSPFRRSYVRTWPSTDPEMRYVEPT